MIRRARMSDRAALEAVYADCFPGEPAFMTWFFDRVWRPEDTLVWQEGDAILADVLAIPVTLALDGERWPAHYIYAAGTLPEARGRGIMGALLNQAFEDGRAAGQQLSVLITQNDSLFDFYRPFGYATLSEIARREAASEALSEGYRLRPAEAGDFPALEALYRAEMAGRLALERDAVHFANMMALFGPDFTVLEDSSGRIEAWACAVLEGESPFIQECGGPKKAALAAVLCNRLGRALVYEGVGEGPRNGCLKALTPWAEALLQGLDKAPYINLMYN